MQATVTGTGAVTATVYIEYSNDMIGPFPGFSFVLAGTDLATAGDQHIGKWAYFRANLTAISGTNAKVTVTSGYNKSDNYIK